MLRSILETVPDAMVVIDQHGVIQQFSKAAERLFGWRAEDVCGQNVKTLMPSPYREQHDEYGKCPHSTPLYPVRQIRHRLRVSCNRHGLLG